MIYNRYLEGYQTLLSRYLQIPAAPPIPILQTDSDLDVPLRFSVKTHMHMLFISLRTHGSHVPTYAIMCVSVNPSHRTCISDMHYFPANMSHIPHSAHDV